MSAAPAGDGISDPLPELGACELVSFPEQLALAPQRYTRTGQTVLITANYAVDSNIADVIAHMCQV
jgi:hypothetical protein